jgi:hypothetical protein
VFLAHAWVLDSERHRTTGPWHWWNVYVDEATAAAQAARRAKSYQWRGLAQTEVIEVKGRRDG